MTRVIVAPAALTGAPLAELKDWLAIRTDGNDALLLAHLRAALDMCESFTGVAPLAQLCEDILPARRCRTRLSAAPVTALVEVRRLTLSGARPALAEADYTFALDADGEARLTLTRAVEEGRIVARYVAGLAPDWERLDTALRQGIVRLAAHYHLERGADGGATPPASVTALWQPWRRLRLR